jgi:hypothetical protein
VAWCKLFPEAEVWVNVFTNSDHDALILCLTGQQNGIRQPHRFRHEASWALDREYRTIVSKAWTNTMLLETSWKRVVAKMERCK